MEVTATDLMYTDSKTDEVWEWPLKYLRKYGCDGDVFSFEAGRKCPGGEGLYAFSTPKASQLFDLVARNITQDMSHPPDNLSPPISADDHDHSGPRFPQVGPTQPQDQPNYHNMGPNGAMLLTVQTELISGVTTDTSRESSVPKPDSPPPVTPTGPPRVTYREVVFQKPPDEHPVPVEDSKLRSPYSKIDFEETQKRLEKRNGSLQVVLPVNPSHSRISTTSAPGDRRPRINTFPASTSKHSISSGSLSSQNSLTESVRETRSPRVNGGVPQSAGYGTDPNMYQNLHLGTSAQQGQVNYQNVNVGCGDANHLTSPPLQPNYANLSLTSGTRSPGYRNTSCPPSRSTSSSSTHHHHPNSSMSASALHSPGDISRVPLPEVHGNPMGHYAELDLSGTQRTSTPRDHHHTPQPYQSSYSELGFPNVTPTPSIPTPTTSPIPEGRTSPVAVRLELQPAPSSAKSSSSSIPVPKLVDDKVNYGVLDFETMRALTELQRQRVQDNQAKKEREEQQAAKKEKVRDKDKSITQRRHTHHK